jgi:hypothetical protein
MYLTEVGGLEMGLYSLEEQRFPLPGGRTTAIMLLPRQCRNIFSLERSTSVLSGPGPTTAAVILIPVKEQVTHSFHRILLTRKISYCIDCSISEQLFSILVMSFEPPF